MRIGLLALILVVLTGCSRPADLAGGYEADHQGLSGQVRIVMTLADDGSGKWEVSGETMPFLWRERGGLLLIHTREGGVVEGRVESRGLRMDMPGVGTVLFVRKSQSAPGKQ